MNAGVKVISERADHAAKPRVMHLLAVARREFMAHGYQHVSVDGIARAASVSKETIYRYFPDKSALFHAALSGLQDEFFDRLTELGTAGDAQSLAQRFVLHVYESVTAGGHLSAVWLVIAIAREFPELSFALNREGLARLEPLRRQLTAIARAQGLQSQVTLDHVANLGAMAVEGPRHMMGWPALEPAERERHARMTARLFLNGCLSRPDSLIPGAAGAKAVPEVAAAARPARGDHILTLMTVARRHFYQRGYRGTGLDEIGAEARVGRGTLYRHFAGKAAMFEAVMLDAAEEIAASAIEELPPLSLAENPAMALFRYAQVAALHLTSANSIALHRTVIAESKRTPRLARQVYTRLRLGLMLPLTEYLANGAASGKFAIEDPDWHARQFLTLATDGNRPLSAAISPDEPARNRIAQRAVTIFLHGFWRSLEDLV